MIRQPARLAILLLAGVAPLKAQENLYPTASAYTGIEARRYEFGAGFPVHAIRQFAFPLAAVVPVGRRFSFDVGTYYAVTEVANASGTSTDEFDHLTDTQIRGSYVFGSDALVASLLVNLPTGKETTTLGQFSVTSSVSSNFLAFPINSYGAGTSVTGGMAAAFATGGWNLGAAASLRISAEYQPFTGSADSTIRYQPGLETRLRVGGDRLVGSGRLNLGFTFSTFSNDQFSGLTGGGGSGEYSPGNRYLAETSYASAVGTGSVTLYAWDFYRQTSSNTSVSNRENVFTTGASGHFPIRPQVALEPLAEARIWSPKDGAGHLIGAGVGLRIDLSPQLAFLPSGRLDWGSIRPPTATTTKSLQSWGAAGYFRYTF
jgi:hypothetical protein